MPDCGDNRCLSRRTAMSGAAALLLPLTACDTSTAPMPTIGYLEPISGNSPTNRVTTASFRQGLAEQGFVEGRNVIVEYRYADGDIDRLPALAKDLVDRNVAVLVASTPNAARAAKALTTSIPIVFGQAADAVDNGEVTNLAHPEANLTGIANFNELSPKRLQLVSAMTPKAAALAYVSDPDLSSFARNLRQTQEEAERLKRKLVVFKAAKDAELDQAFTKIALPDSGVGGVYIGPIHGAYSRPAGLVGLAARHPLPTVYYDRAFVDAGGLMSYGAAFKEIFRMVGVYTGRILNGAKPGDLPVLQTRAFELVLNMRTAKTQGLSIPREILAEASEVLE